MTCTNSADAAGVSLALVVLAATTAAPSVAAEEDLQELLQPLCRLLRAPSLAHACSVPSVSLDAESSSQAEEGSLTLLANMLSHSSRAQNTAAELNLLDCVTAWMRSRLQSASAAALRSAMACLLAVCRPLQPVEAASAGARADAADADTAFAADAERVAGALAYLAAADLRVASGPAADDEPAAAAHQQRPQLADVQEVQIEALQALARVLPVLSSTAAARVAIAGGAWRLHAIDAAVRILQSKGTVPDATLEAALSTLNAIASCFGPLALLRLPTAATPLVQVDAQHATMPVLLLAQSVRVEMFVYLQAAALHHSGGDAVARVSQRTFSVIELCMVLFEALLQLLMTDSLEDFAESGTGGAVDPCDQTGHEMMAAAVLSDEVTLQVRARECLGARHPRSSRACGTAHQRAPQQVLCCERALLLLHDRCLATGTSIPSRDSVATCVRACRCTRQCRTRSRACSTTSSSPSAALRPTTSQNRRQFPKNSVRTRARPVQHHPQTPQMRTRRTRAVQRPGPHRSRQQSRHRVACATQQQAMQHQPPQTRQDPARRRLAVMPSWRSAAEGSPPCSGRFRWSRRTASWQCFPH